MPPGTEPVTFRFVAVSQSTAPPRNPYLTLTTVSIQRGLGINGTRKKPGFDSQFIFLAIPVSLSRKPAKQSLIQPFSYSLSTAAQHTAFPEESYTKVPFEIAFTLLTSITQAILIS
jgi:hypothetical protein